LEVLLRLELVGCNVYCSFTIPCLLQILLLVTVLVCYWRRRPCLRLMPSLPFLEVPAACSPHSCCATHGLPPLALGCLRVGGHLGPACLGLLLPVLPTDYTYRLYFLPRHVSFLSVICCMPSLSPLAVPLLLFSSVLWVADTAVTCCAS